MTNCYLCGECLESYADSNTKNHYEHIIPQSIGGQLKVQGILCKTCGGEKYLGGKVDKPFGDIFSLITERLDIKKDRNTNSVSLNGKLTLIGTDECINISLKDNILSHKRPDYKVDNDSKIVYVYANEKVAKNYRIKVEKELEKQLINFTDYTIKVVSSLNDYLGILELPFNLDNKIFEKGLTKIAIEFALSNGIDYGTLGHLIDREERTIKCNNNVIPYYPIAKIEEMMEYIRTSIDPNFMSHSLMLFSQRQIDTNNKETKKLYCFVELFGTFQYFVELSDNYIGENIEPETYSQRIIKLPESSFKIEWLSPKDLSIYLSELGLTYKDVKGLSEKQICSKLENLYNQKNKYVYDFKENVKKSVESMLRDAILNSKKELISVIPDLRSHFYGNMDNDDFHVTFFRSRFMKDGDPYSIIPAIRETYIENRDKFNRYTFFKFKELSDFINENKSS
jgi:hypothetical protein